jgi:hypothetical protein
MTSMQSAVSLWSQRASESGTDLRCFAGSRPTEEKSSTALQLEDRCSDVMEKCSRSFSLSDGVNVVPPRGQQSHCSTRAAPVIRPAGCSTAICSFCGVSYLGRNVCSQSLSQTADRFSRIRSRASSGFWTCVSWLKAPTTSSASPLPSRSLSRCVPRDAPTIDSGTPPPALSGSSAS